MVMALGINITKCMPNQRNPLDPCETCLKVRRESKKTIHNVPCVRYNLTSITIYRPDVDVLGLTKRFTHNELGDVTDYSDDVIYTINITQGLCPHPIRLEVRRFEPREGDILHRKYMDSGLPKAQDLPPFCLADVKQTVKTFREYIECNARSGLQATADSDGIVKDAFAILATHYDSLDVRTLVT